MEQSWRGPSRLAAGILPLDHLFSYPLAESFGGYRKCWYFDRRLSYEAPFLNPLNLNQWFTEHWSSRTRHLPSSPIWKSAHVTQKIALLSIWRVHTYCQTQKKHQNDFKTKTNKFYTVKLNVKSDWHILQLDVSTQQLYPVAVQCTAHLLRLIWPPVVSTTVNTLKLPLSINCT